MKITAINSAIPAGTFRGILLDEGTKLNSNIYYDHGLEEDIGTVTNITRKSYYPFKNESMEEISKFAEANRSYKSFKNGLVDYVEETIVEVKKALSFTKSEYEVFMKDNNITKEEFIKFIRMFDFVTKAK